MIARSCVFELVANMKHKCIFFRIFELTSVVVWDAIRICQWDRSVSYTHLDVYKRQRIL